MMLTKPLLAVLIAAVTLAAAGQDKKLNLDHLKKSNPNVLYSSTFVANDCPGTQESYEETVEGELLRARIKPASGWSYWEIFLHVMVNCTDPDGTSTMAYDIDVHFAEFRPALPGPDDFNLMLYVGPRRYAYGSVGFRTNHSTDAIERHLKSLLKEYVSEDLTDYLKANFTE